MAQDKHRFYDGSVYIGIVGSGEADFTAYASIQNITTRPGDGNKVYAAATKGYEAREQHFTNFENSEHDFILLLDADEIYPADFLERLRSHRLPFVSGLYMRRRPDVVVPIWFKPYTGKYPLEPWADPIERGKLYHIGASGWGGVLIHRDVVRAVRDLLKGEWLVLEDDMDVWPYDLAKVMGAIQNLRRATMDMGTVYKPGERWAMVQEATAVLVTEIRPLFYAKEPTGSDVRFAFYAAAAGYPLYGDPDARAGHLLTYTLTADDFERTYPVIGEKRRQNVLAEVERNRVEFESERRRVDG